MTIETSSFSIDCTGDVCAGDVILFTEAVFEGSHRNARFVGERQVAGRIIRDSYGATAQQHTFTIKVIASTGACPLTIGLEAFRKGRTIYRNGTRRMPWFNEAERVSSLNDKHRRGEAARRARAERLSR